MLSFFTTSKIILLLSVALIACYVLLVLRKKKTKFDISDIIVMSLGTAGLITSGDILWRMFIYTDKLKLGDFADYWLTIAIGAFAVIATSVIEISKIFDKCRGVVPKKELCDKCKVEI